MAAACLTEFHQKNQLMNESGIKVESERTKIRNRRIALLKKQKNMAAAKKKAKQDKEKKAREMSETLRLQQRQQQQQHIASGRASPTFLMTNADVEEPFDGVITWDQVQPLKEVQTEMPPPNQFKNFESWKVGVKSLNFGNYYEDGGGLSVRPWTTSHDSNQEPPQTGVSTHSVKFDPVESSVFQGGDSNERLGFSRGIDDGSMTASSTGTDTVRFKEKRKMKYPWMKLMLKETLSPDTALEIKNVAHLEAFNPPDTTSMRFY